MNYKWKLLLIAPLLLSFQGSKESLNTEWMKLNLANNLNPSEQSYCLIQDGAPYGMNLNKRMKPASVSKLYTSFWALKSLGAYFRFQTKFYYDNNVLYIESGNDPFFVTENLFLIIEHLNKLGVSELNEIKISHHFLLNWSKNENTIAKNILEIFNTDKWSTFTKQTFNETNIHLKNKNQAELKINNFRLSKVSFDNFKLPKATFIHYSSEIYQHLKQVNIFSNNFYSDALFQFLGGEVAFEEFTLNQLNETKKDIYFYTGSGLGNNYTTCNITLKLIEKLEVEIKSFNLDVTDMISVAGMDGGTLGSRFTGQHSKDKVIAKTGTLKDTSTLAGYLGKNHNPFVILNHSNDATMAKTVQNKFIEKIIEENNINENLEYRKIDYLAIDDVKIQ